MSSICSAHTVTKRFGSIGGDLFNTEMFNDINDAQSNNVLFENVLLDLFGDPPTY